MKRLVFLPLLLAVMSLTGCMNYITQVHTDGEASDVVDETQTPTTTATATVPVSVVPSIPIPKAP